MPPHQNTQRLLDLMSENELSIVDVARLTGRSIQTVKIWRCSNSQIVPCHLLDLLDSRMNSRKANAFLDQRLEYLTSLFGRAAIGDAAVQFAAFCQAYLAAGVIDRKVHDEFMAAARDALVEIGLDLPACYREVLQ